MRAKKKNKLVKIAIELSEYNEILKKCNSSNKYLFDKVLRECNELVDDVDMSDCSDKTNETLEEYKRLINAPKYDSNLIEGAISAFSQYIQNEKETYRILFLPYKYSMWDCLESIFEAAKEDENCEAYVMPIPYYDKDKEGNFTEMHDESESYPDDVGIISWKDNQIDEIDPDIIFIHNPYDGINLITSIHPDYYTNKLVRKDRIVIYVPYYVTYGDNEGTPIPVGVSEIYSDYVIAQSEWQKRQYEIALDDYKKSNEELNELIALFDNGNKVVALGNPKYDKSRRASKSNYPLNDDWKKVLLDSNGNRKFTMLLDTTIGIVLRKRGRMLKKVNEIIGFFEKHDDFALIWRPHPLIIPTLRNMHPELVFEYKKLVDHCKRLDNCIFDDTSDMHLAMAWSDAFMGKCGSMVELHRVTKKPTIMLEVDEKTNFESDGKYDENVLSGLVSDCQVIMEKDYGLGNLIDFSKNYNRDEVAVEASQTDGKKIYDFAIKAAKIKMK